MENLQLHTGETCTVELPDLSTAGYSWVIEGDYASIIDIKESIIKKSEMPGGVQTKQFTITGIKKGEVTISFKQSRTWDKKNSAATVLHYFIIVTD